MSRLPKIEITPRKVRPAYGRALTLYDAEGVFEGTAYSVLYASTRKIARDQARADIAFVREQPSVEAEGYKLHPQAHRDFCLSFPHGGAYMFAAKSTGLALAHLALTYSDHPTIPDFVRRAIEELEATA